MGGCDLEITWEKARLGSPSIDSYKLQVKTDDGSQNIDKCGGDIDDNSCSLSMEELTSEPYNLKTGDRILVRVIAFNSEGVSLPSAKYSPVPRVRGVPQKLSMPELIEESADELNVKWEESEATYDESLTYKFEDNGIR